MSKRPSSHADKRNSRDELKLKLDKLQEQQQNQDVSSQLPDKKEGMPFSNVLGKRDNRASLPVFSGSSTHTAVMNANSGEDVNFIVGLSENLLVECRRLQSENERKSVKLKSLEEDYKKVKGSFERLSAKHEAMSKEEDSLKDSNWQLEVKLQNLSDEFQKLTETFNKNKSELENQIQLSNEMKTELEENSLEKMGLQSELESNAKKYSAEVNGLKERVAELNDENDKLHNQVIALTDKVSALGKELEQDRLRHAAEAKKDSESNDYVARVVDSDHDIQKYESQASDGKPAVNPVLENQTLRTNLNHANQMILKLRKIINGQKFTSPTKSSTRIDSTEGNRSGNLKFVTGNDPSPQKSILSSSRDTVSINTEGSRWIPTTSPSQRNRYDFSDADAESFISETMDYSNDPVMEGEEDDGLGKDRLVDDLDQYAFEEYAKQHHLAIIPVTELESLRNQTADLAKSNASFTEMLYSKLDSLGYFDTSMTKENNIEDIIDVFEHPTEEYLIEKLKAFKLIPVKEDEYRSLTDSSTDRLKVQLEAEGFTVLTKEDHESLLHAWESPKFSYLENKVHELNKAIVDKTEYTALKTPSVTTLRDQCERLGLKVLEGDEFNTLVSQLDSPSTEYLNEKASAGGFTLLTNAEFSKLSSPDLEHLKKLAEQFQHVLVASGYYNELENPSLDRLRNLSSQYKCCVIHNTELEELKHKTEQPDADYLKEKAASLELVIHSKNEYEALVYDVSHPSTEALKRFVTDPSLDSNTLKSLFEEHQSVILLEKDEYQRLHKLATAPQLDDIRSYLKPMGYIAVSDTTFSELTQKLDSPSLDFLSEQALKKGYTLLSKADYADLSRKAHNPSLDEIREAAALSGRLVVLQEEFERLNKSFSNPSKQFISQKASEQDLVVLDKSEHSDLVHKASDKNAIFDAVKGFGFIPMPSVEFMSMKQKNIDVATVDMLQDRIKELGYALISQQELKKYREPITDKATVEETLDLCSKYNLKAISLEEYEALKSNSEAPVLSEDELIDKLKEHGHVVMDKSTYEDLLETQKSPSLIYLTSHLLSFNMVPVNSARYTELQTLETAPTMAFLQEKSKDHSLTLISSEELQSMKLTLEKPSVDFIEEKAKLQGLSVIPGEELQQLQKSFEKPSDAHLSNKANEVGKVLLNEAEYNALLRKTQDPALEEIEIYAKKLDCKLMPNSEYAKLIETSNSPSLEKLMSLCKEHGFSALPEEELRELRQTAMSPSNDFLTSKAAEQQLTLIATVELSKLQDSAVTDTTSLKAAAEQFDQILLSKEEYDSLNNPALPELEKYITQKGHVLLDAETYQILKGSNMESITKQEVLNLCANLKLVPLPEHQYDELKNPTLETIKELIEPQGLVVISRDEFDTLKAKAETPEEDVLVKTAPKYGCKIIGNKELENLQSEAKSLHSLTKGDIDKLASTLGLVVLSDESYRSLMNQAHEYNENVSASPSSKVAANKMFFENVIRKEKSSGSNVVLESGKSLGFVSLSNNEYKKLLENQKKHELTITDIYNGAKIFDLTVLPSDEYKSLLQKKCRDDISYEDLKLYASRFSLKLIPLNANVKTDSSRSVDQAEKLSNIASLNLNHSDNHSTVSFNSVETDSEYFDANQSSSVFQLSGSESKASLQTSSTYYSDAIDFHETDNVSVASTIKENEQTIEDLKRHAEVLGYKLVKLTEVEIEQETNSVSSPDGLTKDLICTAAPRFGLSVIPNEEFVEMEKLLMSKKSTLPDIRKAAEEFGLVVMNKQEHMELLNKTSESPTTISKENIKQKAREHGFVPVATTDYLKLIKPDNVEDLKEKAAKLGMVALSTEELSEMTKPLDKEDLETRAKELELVAVPALEYSKLTKPLTATDVRQICDEMGLVAVEKEQYALAKFDLTSVQKWATDNNKVLISKDEYDHMVEIEDQTASGVMTKDELIEKAHELNMIPLDADKFEEIQRELASSGRNSLTEDDIVLKAKEFGFVAVPLSQYEGKEKKTITTKEELINCSKDFGLIPIPVDQFEQIKKELETPTLTREQIVDHASDFKLIAIDVAEYKRLKKGSHLIDTYNDSDSDDDEDEDDLELVDSEIKQLNRAAKRFGLLCIPESAFVATSNASTPDVHNVVILPIKYYNTLLHQESENWAKITDESLQAEAKRRGFQVGLNIRRDVIDFPHNTHKRNPSGGARSIVSDNARRSLSEAAATAAMAEMEQQSRSRAPSRSSSVKRTSPSVRTNLGSVLTNSESVATGLSLATMASLTAPSIIPALTQTMIGEYLHKYYRRLGTLAGSSRHERYFWIHPYTLTLYWSTSNPVLDNPGNNKTRAAAIIGVESIEDPNPYPAGLYHKSIIVKTDGRDIKLTCASRQRHNIWFNSFRYLLQRNLDGINLDDMLKDAEQTDPNAIYQLPGESYQSATRRLSTTRRASLSSSNIKRQASKWSLHATQ